MLTLFSLKILIKIGQLEIFPFKLMELITYTMKQNTKPKIKEPIDPDTVLLGLILVSFFPPKVFPNTYPPMSEKTQIISIVKKKYLSITKTLKQTIKAIKTYIKKSIIWIIRYTFFNLIFSITFIHSIQLNIIAMNKILRKI